MVARIKKNDTVGVISGKNKGKVGVVIDILPKIGKVMVKGVNVVTKHAKARRSGENSGIKSVEAALPLEKVMPICPSCKKACRVQATTLDNGKLSRICNKCKENF